MEIVNIGEHIIINGPQDEATKYLLGIGIAADLVVVDPDYKFIGDYLKTSMYEDLRKLLKNRHHTWQKLKMLPVFNIVSDRVPVDDPVSIDKDNFGFGPRCVHEKWNRFIWMKTISIQTV